MIEVNKIEEFKKLNDLIKELNIEDLKDPLLRQQLSEMRVLLADINEVFRKVRI
jgi:hypothetical protein